MAIHSSTPTAMCLALALAGCAQQPAAPGGADHTAHHPPAAAAAAAPAASTDHMAMMDAHMKAMREMHEKMSRAATPQERQALMAEHRKLMHDGMAMMGGMGSKAMGGMAGMRGMGAMGAASAASAPMDMAAHHQMMDKRMQMMRSMMQMMMERMDHMERMGAPASRP